MPDGTCLREPARGRRAFFDRCAEQLGGHEPAELHELVVGRHRDGAMPGVEGGVAFATEQLAEALHRPALDGVGAGERLELRDAAVEVHRERRLVEEEAVRDPRHHARHPVAGPALRLGVRFGAATTDEVRDGVGE